LKPDFIVVDEIAQWPNTALAEERFDALSSAMLKKPGARMVLLTTAGAPAHWSYRIREQASRSPRWRLHEVPGHPHGLTRHCWTNNASGSPPSATTGCSKTSGPPATKASPPSKTSALAYATRDRCSRSAESSTSSV